MTGKHVHPDCSPFYVLTIRSQYRFSPLLSLLEVEQAQGAHGHDGKAGREAEQDEDVPANERSVNVIRTLQVLRDALPLAVVDNILIGHVP